jgi:hypothetical protein
MYVASSELVNVTDFPPSSFKEKQLDAQFIFSIFRQTPLHISGVSMAHHQELHRMGTTIGTYFSLDD